MRLLLDTHVFLWWRHSPSSLSPKALHAVATAEMGFVSVVSAWEVAIKKSIGKLAYAERFAAGVAEAGLEPLDLSFSHTEALLDLPHHHGDPFDRMLIVQALVEGLTIVSADRRIASYDVPVLWD